MIPVPLAMASLHSDANIAVQRSSPESNEKVAKEDPESVAVIRDDDEQPLSQLARYRPFILGGLALLILAWWISSTVLLDTRHRW